MKLLLIQIIIFFLAITAGIIIMLAITSQAQSQDELMLCDGCKMNVLMGYDGEHFTNITLIYEWWETNRKDTGWVW